MFGGQQPRHRPELAADQLTGDRAIALGGNGTGRYQAGREGIGDHHPAGIRTAEQRLDVEPIAERAARNQGGPV